MQSTREVPSIFSSKHQNQFPKTANASSAVYMLQVGPHNSPPSLLATKRSESRRNRSHKYLGRLTTTLPGVAADRTSLATKKIWI